MLTLLAAVEATRRLWRCEAVATARAMIESGGPREAHRSVAARDGLRSVVGWLADRFTAEMTIVRE